MSSSSFADAIKTELLIFDGAMGTEIYAHHVFTNRCFDELNLSDPKLIRSIHSEYAEAGADVLTTNTFGANRVALGRFGLAEKTCEINAAGARNAKEIANGFDRKIYVAGSIGPLPAQPQYEDQIESMIVEQVDALIGGGADFILFETQPSRKAIERCAKAMKSRPTVPYVLSFVVANNGETAAGESVELMLSPLPVDVPKPIAMGMNCGCGPDGLLSAVERAVRSTHLPLIVQPNAGLPKEVENRHIYLSSPEYFTEFAKRFVSMGVSAVGGCCGTSPAHIREMAQTVKPLSRMQTKVVVSEAAQKVQGCDPSPLAERSHWAKMLVEKEWVTTVELTPPRGYDLTSIIEKSRKLKEKGVSAVNLPDGPRASARISSLIAAERIWREAHIEPILHFCCRDRNLIGMQADLLACAACGVRNILFITGDPPKLGDYPHATGVFDADSIAMAAVQRRLNRGVDLGGQLIDPPTHAVIGVGLDPNALDQAKELERFRRKVDAGAEFAITQPVFDPDALLRFLDKIADIPIPIVAGVWPLVSYRNASFMQNEVPGVVVPDEIMRRMASVESREGQLAMGISIAVEAVQRIRSRISGVQASAPFGRIETALAVIEGANG